jgi:hypothetical protein
MGNLYVLREEAANRGDWNKWHDIATYQLKLNEDAHQQWLKDMEVKRVKMVRWFAKLNLITFVVALVGLAIWFLVR